MLEYRDDCVDCGLPCIGSACKYKKVTVFTCDSCGEETSPEELYMPDGKEGEMFCPDCLLKMFPKADDYNWE